MWSLSPQRFHYYFFLSTVSWQYRKYSTILILVLCLLFVTPLVLKEYERERYDFDLTMFYENRFWNQRPDYILIDKNHRTLYILEFKRSYDRNMDFLRVKEDEANEQHKSIIEALKATAPEWTFEQINFVAERRGAVLEDDFYNKLEKLNVQAGEKDKILLAHVQSICEVHDTVMRSYYQQI